MSPKRLERWQCDWCARVFTTEHVAHVHERTCEFNPRADRPIYTQPLDQAGHATNPQQTKEPND